MKAYRIEISPDAEKAFAKLDNQIATRIKNWLNKNLEGCENPRYKGF